MRKLLAVLALAGAAFSIADYLGWRASHTRLTALADTSGLMRWRPEIARELRRKPPASRATSLLAWNLLDLELDRSWLADLPEAERQEEMQRGLERLALAEELAAEVVARQPASWQAYTVLGGSRFLAPGRQGRRDRPDDAWRQPLATAMRLAPNHSEPLILLASAELSRWSTLAPPRREALLPLLARAFETRRGLDLLLASWVRVAPSREQLFRVIPNSAPSWERLGAEFLRLGDLERFAAAHTEWKSRLPSFLAQRVADARDRLAGGDRRSAEGLLRSVLAAPHDVALAQSFSAALLLLPDEMARDRERAHLRRWLSWAIDLCVLRSCPLGPETLGRLSRRLGDLEPVDRALAALTAGELDAARALEPAAGTADDALWNRYWIYKADRLADYDLEEARRALSRVVRSPRDEIRFRSALMRLAELEGDDAEIALARRSLAELQGTRWTDVPWSGGRTSYRSELLVATAAGGVSLTAGPTRKTGAAIELRWDGRAVGVAALQQGQSERWLFEVTPGLHLVEVANPAGRPVRPTELRLEPTAPAG